MATTLGTLRDAIMARLAAQPWASANGLTIIARKPGMTGAQIKTTLLGLKTPGVLVFMPRPVAVLPDMEFAGPHDVSVELQVVANNAILRSALEADEVGILCLKALHHWIPDGFDTEITMDADPFVPSDTSDPYTINLSLTTKSSLE